MSAETDIIVLCQYFEPDVAATGVVLTEVAEDLVRSGFIVDCITAQPAYAGHGSAPKEESLRGIHVRRLSTVGGDRHRLVGRLLRGLSYTVQAWWHVLQTNRSATLVITTSPPGLGIIALAEKLILSRRYIYIVHDIYPDIAVRMGVLGAGSIVATVWQWLERQVLRRASAVIVQGRDMQRVMRAKLPVRLWSHVHVIALGADPHRVRPRDATRNPFRARWNSNDQFVALYAGNMGVCHDLETILEAAALLRGEPIRIVFSGGGVKRNRLEAVAKARGLTNVTFHDYVPADRLNELLASCDVGLVAVDRSAEGLLVPWKLYNLMAAGKAVVAVASDESETGRTITTARCGELIEHGRADRLADCLRALRRDRSRGLSMGAAGRQYLVANLSRQRRGREFVQIFHAVRTNGSRLVLPSNAGRLTVAFTDPRAATPL